MAEVVGTPQIGNITNYTIISTSSDTTFETAMKGFTINPKVTYSEIKTANENLLTTLSTDTYSDTRLTSEVLVSEKFEPVTFEPSEILFEVKKSPVGTYYSSGIQWLYCPPGTTGGYFTVQEGDPMAVNYSLALKFNSKTNVRVTFGMILYYQITSVKTKNCTLTMSVNGNSYEIPVTIRFTE